MPGGAALADHAISQEQAGRDVLGRLEKLEAWDDGFERLLREYIMAAREHVAFEETKVWPGLREALGTQEIGELGDSLVKAKEHGPDR
jgi:anion-transporting  ArsA/GET3 family ATPase